MSVGVLKCSSITLREDPEIYTLMPFIERFVVEVERCNTIDCYLIKLATLVDSVKEHFPRERTRRVLEKIMKCDEVQDSMSPSPITAMLLQKSLQEIPGMHHYVAI
jgi:hypothetical protein